jgi:hypothetical protein
MARALATRKLYRSTAAQQHSSTAAQQHSSTAVVLYVVLYAEYDSIQHDIMQYDSMQYSQFTVFLEHTLACICTTAAR